MRQQSPPFFPQRFFSFLLLVFYSPTLLAEDLNLSDAEVGKLLFFDVNLSGSRTMSCATCHDPSNAFSDQRKNRAQQIVSRGANGHSFGTRNAPTASYANTSPTFHFDEHLQEFIGGQFLDGRSSTLAQQSLGPPLNDAEMDMPSAEAVVERLQENPIYVQAFKAAYGEDIFYIQKKYSKYRQLGKDGIDPNAFIAMGNFIEAFENTDYFSPFDSKYDRYLKGEYTLTPAEEAGRKLFFEDLQVSCRNCHLAKEAGSEKEVFTNRRFNNVGVPRNPELLKLLGDESFIDTGMMTNNTHTNTEDFKGKFKVPTLRNIAITQPYMHNGVFRHLRTVVEFFDHYNNPARPNNPETGQPWAAPEVAENLAIKDLKGRPLTDKEIDDLTAFLTTLTDKRYETINEKSVID